MTFGLKIWQKLPTSIVTVTSLMTNSCHRLFKAQTRLNIQFKAPSVELAKMPTRLFVKNAPNVGGGG